MEERVIRFNPILSVKNTLAYNISLIVEETLKEFMPDRRFYIKTIDLDLTSENRNLAVRVHDIKRYTSASGITQQKFDYRLDSKEGIELDFTFTIKEPGLMDLMDDIFIVNRRFFSRLSEKWKEKKFSQKIHHILVSSDYMIGKNGRLYKPTLEHSKDSYPELNVYTNNPDTGKFDKYVGSIEGIEKIDYVNEFVYFSMRGGSTMAFQPIKVTNLFITDKILK